MAKSRKGKTSSLASLALKAGSAKQLTYKPADKIDKSGLAKLSKASGRSRSAANQRLNIVQGRMSNRMRSGNVRNTSTPVLSRRMTQRNAGNKYA